MDETVTNKARPPRKKKPKIVINGDLVETLRKANKLSQSELGKRCYMTQAMVSYVERGDATPGVDTAYFLANAFKIPVGDLLMLAEDEG